MLGFFALSSSVKLPVEPISSLGPYYQYEPNDDIGSTGL